MRKLDTKLCQRIIDVRASSRDIAEVVNPARRTECLVPHRPRRVANGTRFGLKLATAKLTDRRLWASAWKSVMAQARLRFHSYAVIKKGEKRERDGARIVRSVSSLRWSYANCRPGGLKGRRASAFHDDDLIRGCAEVSLADLALSRAAMALRR